MTAVAGILNKQGVAIAADSAVTVSGLQNRKVYNSANKIFTLSKFHPVGIAIYNSAEFMGIPWEVLIKEYRRKLERKSFPKLEHYRSDFFSWLAMNEYFSAEWNESQFLFNDFLNFFQAVLNGIPNIGRAEIDRDVLIEEVNNFNQHYLENTIPNLRKLGCFKKRINLIKNKVEGLIPSILSIVQNKFGFDVDNEDLKKYLVEAYLSYLEHEQFLQFTGLIFTGYGDKEIFPRLLSTKVSIVIGGILRYFNDKDGDAVITSTNSSIIAPFAQTDVIQTILRGISPELNSFSTNIMSGFLQKFISQISELKGIPEEVVNELNKLNLDSYVSAYRNQFENIVQQKHVEPLMSAVANLSKEDLAEMAESLVYLTYLKRRFTMAEESVGGPVDIAVITKGDGFIWIKRKHYFDPNLNQTFFQKYFKSTS